jgi:hypothetical protein
MDAECIWIEIAAAATEELVCRQILMVGGRHLGLIFGAACCVVKSCWASLHVVRKPLVQIVWATFVPTNHKRQSHHNFVQPMLQSGRRFAPRRTPPRAVWAGPLAPT